MLRNKSKPQSEEVSTAYVTFVSGSMDQFNGVLDVSVIEGFAVIVDEKGSTTLIPAHRIANVVVTPGRD